MPEHVEAIKTIFPRLHEVQKEAILDKLTDKGLPIKLNLSQKASLGRFLGTATQPMFSAAFIQNTQGAYGEARKAQQGEKKGMNIKSPDLTTAAGSAQAL